MCEIRQCAPMGHSTLWLLDYSIDWHIYSKLQEVENIDVLHTLGVHLICNQFWHCPFCNVHQIWQPEELHQMLLASIKDLSHLLLIYLIARQSTINLTINSHWYHNIQVGSTSPNNSIHCKLAPGRETVSGEWSEQWQLNGLKFLSAPRMMGMLQCKQTLVKW